MSDLFHEEVPDGFIDQLMCTVDVCSEHVFQVLTKRPRRMLSYCESRFHFGAPPNLWLGVSAEDQKAADERIQILIHTPAAVRFLSCEPLLGEIDLCLRALNSFGTPKSEIAYRGEKIDWVICGGESGPRARPMHPNWARSLRDQCVGVGIPFFFKQWGEWNPLRCGGGGLDPDHFYPGRDPERNHEFSDGARTYRVGKRNAGRLLDGREWNEFPKAQGALVAA